MPHDTIDVCNDHGTFRIVVGEEAEYVFYPDDDYEEIMDTWIDLFNHVAPAWKVVCDETR